MAYTWVTPTTMSVSVNVNTNDAGYIATGEDEVAGVKGFSLNGIKRDATFAQTKSVLDAFIGDIADGSYIEGSAVGTIKFGVVETA